MNIPSFAVIIAAAGQSERFNKGRDEKVKKEYLQLDGHSILYKATEPFLEVPGLSAIVVTCPKGSEDETVVALEDIADIGSIPILIIPGGKTRTESVKNAINALKELPFSFEYIAIHDGARPFINPEIIIKTLAAATVATAAAPAMRVTDALKRLGKDGMIHENVDRSDIIRVQTPQIFNKDNLIKAYSEISDEYSGFDDIEIYINSGFNCTVIQGDESNKKITYFKDIPNAEEQIESYIATRERGRNSARATRRMRELLNQKEDN